MKRFLVPLILTMPATSWADDFYSAFPVTAATVFSQGAMVSQMAQVQVPEGTHDIFLPMTRSTLGGAPKFAVAGATPISVSFVEGLPVDAKLFWTDAQTAAHDAVEDARQKIVDHRAEFSTLAGQRDGLDAQFKFLNQITPNGKDAVPSLEQLQGIATYLPQALAENRAARGALEPKLIEGQKKLADLEEELARAERELTKLGLPDWNSLVARVTVANDNDPTVQVFFEGFTHQANWQMQYDATLDETASQITLDRRAMVSQYTGTAWIDADITLSSAEPFQRLQPTVPNRDVVQLLKEKQAFPRTVSKSNIRLQAESLNADVQESAVFAGAAAPAPVSGNFNGIEVTYDIPNPTTIFGSNESAEQINLTSITLDAEVDRYASPRRDQTAFVRAISTNETGEPILPGQATFYRGDTLIGQGHMPAITNGAEETLYFGPEKTLPLEVRFLSELKGDKGIFVSSNTRQEELEFEVHNIGPDAQSVTVAYALPITVNEDVEVDVSANPKPDTTDVDGVKGRSEWTLNLNPGEKQIVKINVDITWPDGQTIHWQP